ncbi:MAG: NTP transferase domain-containing protein [Spirochaetales bacterium]|nr:NTP transferase domain-containing protein [Spirochaetales bacterium]
MTGVLLQVRIDSTRLPGKALLPLGGKTVCEQVMDALSPIQAQVFVLVTEEGSRDALAPLVKGSRFILFTGPKEDVLLRYIQGAEYFGVDTVVRATGDNPLVSAALANMLLQQREEEDYLAFDGPPLGTGVEVVRTSALKKAAECTQESYHREHVCPYIYQNPLSFRVQRLQAPDAYCAPGHKVTLDTSEDYSRLLTIYNDLYKDSPIDTRVLCEYLKNRNVLSQVSPEHHR